VELPLLLSLSLSLSLLSLSPPSPLPPLERRLRPLDERLRSRLPLRPLALRPLSPPEPSSLE
jgi:hypothetical protein